MQIESLAFLFWKFIYLYCTYFILILESIKFIPLLPLSENIDALIT